MAGRLAVFDRVMNEVLLEFRETLDRTASLLVSSHGARNVAGVSQPVHITNLIAVVGWDRHLFDSVALMVEFDDNFGIEVKIIGHVREIDILQSMQAIGAIAAMELREIR